VRGFLAYPRGGMSGVGLRNLKTNGDIGQAAASAFDMPPNEPAMSRPLLYCARRCTSEEPGKSVNF
jgi:hypothetical protein